MTPQEQEMIGDLVDRVQKTQLEEKDIDAEQMLKQGMGKNPDSLYILAQTVLVQKYALEQAQMQLTQAKAQIEQMQQHPEPKHTSSFLGNLLGRNDAPAPPPPPPAQGWATVPAYPQSAPGVGYPQSAAPIGMGGGGGFLQGALQTAAGVAAGALAFEGVESLMHGFGHAGGYGQGFGGFGDRPTEVINNYYGDDRGDRGEHGVSNDERVTGDQGDRDFGGGRDDRGGSLDDRGTSDVADASSFDNSGSGLDDSSSFDDGGSNFDDGSSSFDDGGGDFGGGGDGDSSA
jgi:uncharacterized protein